MQVTHLTFVLYKDLNVICALHSMSIQKILTIIGKNIYKVKDSRIHIIISIQPLLEQTF